MSLSPLTDEDEIRRAQQLMVRSLKKGGDEFSRTVGYRGGRQDVDVYWHSNYGFWFGQPKPRRDLNQYWCAFGRTNPHSSHHLGIICEINSPFEGVNRRKGGVFLKSENGKIFLAHSGKIGGGGKGVGKSAFLANYRGGAYLEDVVWPDKKQTQHFVIGRVGGVHFLEQVSSFVKEVERIKVAVRSGTNPLPSVDETLSFKPEFSGIRKPYSHSDEIESRCDHGLVINALADELESRGYQIANDRRDLVARKGGMSDSPTFLFEAKTNVSPTNIYAAIGQLMYHSVVADTGMSGSRRIMVVPGMPDETTRRALKKLDIRVVRYRRKGEAWMFPGLDDLQ